MTVEKQINNVVKRINENPLIYHREADIRAMLYNELCNEYSDLYNTELGYKTGLVHCEYFGGDRKRIDVVVFDKKDIKKISTNTFEIREIGKGYHVKISDAIEIKTELGFYGCEEQKNKAYNDIDKLTDLRKKNPDINLYLLYIVRWRHAKDKRKIIDYTDDIEKKCRDNNIIFKTNNKSDYFLQNPLQK